MDARMKGMAWLAKWAAAALLISALSVWTTFYLVESYMEKLLAQWNLTSFQAHEPDFGLGGLFAAANGTPDDEPATSGRSGGDGDGPRQQETAQDGADEANRLPSAGREKPTGGALKVDAVPDAGEAADPQVAAGAESAPGDAPGRAAGNDGIADLPDGEALPVFGQVVLPDALVMSAEQFNDRRKNLSEADRRDLFALFFSKLPQEELQRLSFLLEDGITADEADTILEVMNAHLEQNEVNRLLQILTQE